MHKTIQCHVCRMPYLVYMHTVEDQSVCPMCVRKAERRMNRRPISEIMPDAAKVSEQEFGDFIGRGCDHPAESERKS